MQNRMILTVLCSLLLATACAKNPNFSCDSDQGRNAIVAEVDQELSRQNCAGALIVIEPYYSQVGCGTDDIRQARAAANSCAANINFFQLVDDLGTSNLLGSGLWVALTRLFPSSVNDQRLTAGQNALDALFALRKPGILTPPAYIISPNSVNPGSLLAGDRTEDSNLYAMLVSMSLVGTLQNRFGAPQGNWHKGQKLGATLGNPNGWETVTAVDVNACTYAGAVLTLFDSIGQVTNTIGTSLGGNAGTALTTAASIFSTLMDTACEAGCSACGLAAGSCTPCPLTLRDRNSCKGIATDKPSCAAAGIAAFIDSSVAGWPN
ncbi:MAG: hypothetical protein H7301_02500 [Cryobacterium sp.]|nr:hypothetical protein [Oligoflexia bacterium]